MNNHPAQPDPSNDHKKEVPVMRFGKRHLHQRVVYVSLGVLATVLFICVSFFGITYQVSQQPSAAIGQNVTPPAVSAVEKNRGTASLIKKLKQYGLWKLPASEEVPRFFIQAYPADLNTVEDISVKKRIFLHSLLPHALFVRQEALQRRSKLESIFSKIDCSVETLNFDSGLESENQCSWTDFLTAADVGFIQNLCKKYRTTSAEELLKRVDAVPISIILAQGALESSWGSSRFTREGNSIFGMWTWKTPGIVPSQREEGKTHKVKAYENVLESVRAYQLTLNRLDSYEQFRQLRRITDDPLILAEGLSLYSERGKDYVEDIKNVILSNNLQRYDRFSLTDLEPVGFARAVSGVINLAGRNNASL